MNRIIRLGTAAALAATALGAAAPAMARPWGYGGGWHHYHRGGGGLVPGLLIGGLIGGGLVAAANADRGPRYAYDAPPPPPPSPAYGDEISSRERAVDLCAQTAEQRGHNARVEGINGAYRTDGGWVVDGNVDSGDRNRARFTCTTRFGQVQDLAFSN